MSTALAIDPVRRPTPTAPAAVAPEAPTPRRTTAAAPDPFRISRRGLAAAGALVAGVGCVLAAQLLLSIQTADGAFHLQRLQTTSVELGRQLQVRSERLQTLAAPQRLAARATALGMVPGEPSAFLRLENGRVLGSPAAPAAAPDGPTVPVADALLTPDHG